MEEEELGKFYEEKQSLMETKLSQERRQHSRANSHRGTEHSNRVMTYQQFREYNTERPELKTNPFFGGRDNNSTRMNNTIQSTVKSNKKVNVFRKTNSAVNIHSKKQPIRNMNKKSMHSNSSIDDSKFQYKPLSTRLISFHPSLPESTKSNNKGVSLSTSTINPEGNINLNKSTQSFFNERSYNMKDIEKLYSDRQSLLSRMNNRKKTKDESFREFYDNNISFVSQKNEKNEKLLNEKIDNELKECTFKPKLSDSTLKLLNKSADKPKGDFYEKNILWKKARDQNIQKEMTISEKKQFEECYFHPISNLQQYEEVLKELKDKSDDYIYQKNIEWLSMKRMNQKKGEMEHMEKMKQQKENFKQGNRFLVEMGKMQNPLSPKENLEYNLAKPKYYNTKRAQSVRVKARTRAQWLEEKKDNDTYYIPYEKAVKKEQVIIDSRTVKNEFSEIKSMLASLKETIKENRKIINNYTKPIIKG